MKKGSELKRNNSKPPVQGEPGGKQGAANSKRMPKKGAKELRVQKGDNGALVSQGAQDSLVCGASRARVEKGSSTNGLSACRYAGVYTDYWQRSHVHVSFSSPPPGVSCGV